MPIDTNLLIYILLGLIAVLAGMVAYLWIKVARLLRGKDARTLEDTMRALQNDIDALRTSRAEIEGYLKQVERRLRRAISRVGTVRFNPFQGSSGSNQSFATAFLSEEGDGVVLSSLYSRDRVSVFAKPFEKGASSYELTGEEKEAIAKSKERE
ncbi:MAG: DUF4446 family protein [bacterium]|nr:DUF4446 family protein [bacterium]